MLPNLNQTVSPSLVTAAASHFFLSTAPLASFLSGASPLLYKLRQSGIMHYDDDITVLVIIAPW